MKNCILFLCCLLVVACNDDVIVKPNAKLRLDYPRAVYKKSQTNCDYDFDFNNQALHVKTPNCGTILSYPAMKAAVYITHQKVSNNNLNSLLYDAQKLAYNHDRIATSIQEKVFKNKERNTYGVFYSINGDAASQSHFYLTDSLQNFVTGSLYFDAKPNFDSIYPAVVYLREDIMYLMETLEWN